MLDVPRTFASFPLSKAKTTELCVFSDASCKAIAAVAYLKVTDEEGHIEVGFVLGKAKLAPSSEPTIPRLELCAAVLAVEVAEFVKEEIGQKLDKVTLYTDSKVVLGYICNDSRRFYVYVHNRVQRIRQSTCPSQWKYVATDNNPADHGTRSVSAGPLQSVNWLSGPSFLLEPENSTFDNNPQFEVVDPDSDVEIRPIVTACSTNVSVKELGTKPFERFSSWSSLTKSTARLCHIAQGFSKISDNPSCRGRHICATGPTIAEIKKAEHIIIKSVFSPT